MGQIKTTANGQPVERFLDKIPSEQLRNDCYALIKLMERATGDKAMMWGNAIIGFGSYHYKYESGREGDMCLIGFSPRQANIALYGLTSLPGHEELLAGLGKHKTGKACLYLKNLAGVNMPVLEILAERSVRYLKDKHTG